MSQGLSGTYAINSIDIGTFPTTGQWLSRDEQGIDGNAHPIYPAYHEFELTWNLMSPADWAQILNAYNIVQNTGTVAFDLPQFDASDYRFKTYSGTTIAEPESEVFEMGYRNSVRLLILNIRI